MSCAALLLLATCNVEDDDASWMFVSNPSAGTEPIQGGLIFGYSSGSNSISVIRASVSEFPSRRSQRVIGLDVTDLPPSSSLAARRILLATETDFAVVITGRQASVHGPCFTEGRLELGEVESVELAPDSAGFVRLVTANGVRLSLSAWGNLAVHETSSYTHVRTPGSAPRVHAPGAQLEARGENWFLREADGRGWLLTPPSAHAPGHQFAFVRGREAIRFFSPYGLVMAELPAQSFDVLGGEQGVLLDGRFPHGAPGALSGTFRAILPLRNRHLLILRGATTGG